MGTIGIHGGPQNGLDVDVTSIAAGDNNIGNVDIVTIPAITGSVTANAGTNLNTSLLALESGNLATVVTALASLLTELTAKTEPDDVQNVGAQVNDKPQSYFDGDTQPLSLTNEGRLRVSAVQADIYSAWQYQDDSGWSQENMWEMGNLYV